MAEIRRGHEYFLLLVNRGATPAAFFLALAVFQRAMSNANFESFLLAYSLCQWLLAFGFQWQKNAVVRLFHYQRYYRVSLVYLSLAMLCTSAFYIGFSYYSDMEILAGGLVYTVVAGLLYFVSTNYRMRGSVKIYANVDTAFQILRWVLAAIAVVLLPYSDAPFWGASSALIMALGVFLLLSRTTTPDGPVLTWREYLATGIFMAIFDFAGSGMMYIDRFYIQDADYILHSTVSTQIGAVLFGALIATAYPRVSQSWRQGGDGWKQEFKHMARFLIPLFMLTPILCVSAGPILLKILSPGSPVDFRILITGGISQSLHHVIYFITIVLILYGKNYVSAAVYLCAFLLYTGILMVANSHDWLFVSASKSVCLLVALSIIGLFTFVYTRKPRTNVTTAEN